MRSPSRSPVGVGYDPATMRRTIVLGALLLGSCAVSQAVNSLGEASPPPAFGRPLWVRAFATTGAWLGGTIGTVVSIATLPVTYPISLLGDDELGDTGEMEFLLFPAISGASIGHAFLGGAADVVDYTLYRAWVDDESVVGAYDYVPQTAPSLPKGGEKGGGDDGN